MVKIEGLGASVKYLPSVINILYIKKFKIYVFAKEKALPWISLEKNCKQSKGIIYKVEQPLTTRKERNINLSSI